MAPAVLTNSSTIGRFLPCQCFAHTCTFATACRIEIHSSVTFVLCTLVRVYAVWNIGSACSSRSSLGLTSGKLISQHTGLPTTTSSPLGDRERDGIAWDRGPHDFQL